MYSNNRDAYRQTFFNAWEKYKQQVELEAIEKQLVEVILLHPEYQAFLEKAQQFEQQEFAMEENPFMHMSLHMAIREQISMQRPLEIIEVRKKLAAMYVDPHEVEHRMMECLAKMLWDAQLTGNMPSEEDYIALLKKL